MKKYIILAFLIIGCGSRKSELQKTDKQENTKQTEVVKNDIKKESQQETKVNVVVTDSVKEEIEETIIETPLQKTTTRKIKRFKALKSNDNTNIVVNEKSTDKTTTVAKKTQSTKENNKTKNTERSFSIWSYWWVLILIVVLWWLYRKYKNILYI